MALNVYKWRNISIYLLEDSLTYDTAPGQAEPGVNGKKWVFHIPKTARTRASPPDVV